MRSSPAVSSVVSSIRRFEVEEVVHVCDIARLRVSWGSHQGRDSESKTGEVVSQDASNSTRCESDPRASGQVENGKGKGGLGPRQ